MCGAAPCACSAARLAHFSTTMKLSDRLPWIVQMMHEHMDKVVDAAKVEIENYVARTTTTTGLGAGTAISDAPMLPSASDDETVR